MTGYKWVHYPTKIWNVIQQRWGGGWTTVVNSAVVPHEKGGPKAAPSPADLSRDARRGDIAASFRGLAATPPKADRRSYNATVVLQWSCALTSSTTGTDSSQKKGGRSRPS